MDSVTAATKTKSCLCPVWCSEGVRADSGQHRGPAGNKCGIFTIHLQCGTAHGSQAPSTRRSALGVTWHQRSRNQGARPAENNEGLRPGRRICGAGRQRTAGCGAWYRPVSCSGDGGVCVFRLGKSLTMQGLFPGCALHSTTSSGISKQNKTAGSAAGARVRDPGHGPPGGPRRGGAAAQASGGHRGPRARPGGQPLRAPPWAVACDLAVPIQEPLICVLFICFEGGVPGPHVWDPTRGRRRPRPAPTTARLQGKSTRPARLF